MGKALKTVGAVIGGAVLIATGVGALAGLQVTALGIAGVGTASVGTLNTISAGLMAVGGMLDKPKSEGSGSPTEWTSNPDQPIPFAFGRIGVAGKIVHRDEFGPNDNMYQVVAGILSGAGPINRVVSFSGNREPVTFDANGKAITSQWRDEMWMRYRLGAQPDTAITSPTGLWNNATVPGWTSQHKLSGKAHYLQIMGENSKRSAYPMGEPDPIHVIEGLLVYDPRFDSTYPGGFGPCRYNDRSTWRYTGSAENGAVVGLNWALGLRENGVVVGGGGISMGGIDVAAFVEAANIADANNWKMAGWPDSSEDASQVLKQMLEAAGAVYARHAGLVSCVSRGAPRPAIVTISGRDTAGPIELDTGSSMFNRLNTITPSFMSESHGWKHVPAAPVSFSQYVTDDGGKRGDGITYRFVPAAKQAAQLAAYDILDAREPFSGTVPLKPHLRRLKRGDCFLISEPDFMMDGVKCLVLGRSYDTKTGEVRITFRSETDAKHPLALGKTTTLPDYPELEAVDPIHVTPPLPEDWVITPRPPAGGGAQQPGLDLNGVVSNATATAVLIEYGPTDEGPWKQAYEGPPDVTNIPLDGLQPNEVYFVAVRYRRGSNFSDRYVYGPYTAPPLVADDTQNVAGVPAPDLLEVIGNHSLNLLQIAGDLGLLSEETQAASEQASLAVQAAGAVQANLNDEATVRANADAAMATRTSAVEATLAAASPFPPVSSANARDHFTLNYNLAPADASPLDTALVRQVPGVGQVLVLNVVYLATRGVHRIDPARSYQINARVRRTLDPATGDKNIRFYWGKMTEAFVYSNGNPGWVGPVVNIGDGFVSIKGPVVSGATLLTASPGAVFVRPIIRGGSVGQAAQTGEIEIAALELVDVTDVADVAARVSETEAAIASADGLLAFWKREVTVPGAAAFIVAQAKASSGALPTSSVAIGASVFAISNPSEDGGWRVAMKTENFQTIFYGGLSAASFTLLGNGVQWQLAYRSKTFVRADGATISFGANLGGLPQYEFLRDNLLPLSAGETYALTLTNLTATGATVSAKINVPGSPGAQSSGPTTTVQSSGPRYQLGVTAASKPVSVDGVYSVSGGVQGNVRVYGKTEEEVEITVSGTVLIWARKAGVWSQVGTASWSDTDTYFNPGLSPINVPFSASYSGDIQMGSNVESIGVTIGTASAGSNSVNVSSLSTEWTSQTTPSGVRSALASGAKTTIRIIPQG